jgi:hypothetical protein
LEEEDRQITMDHDEAMQFFAVVEAETREEEAERKRLEVEEKERRMAERAEEERIAEIGRRIDMKKKEKAAREEVERKRREKNEK